MAAGIRNAARASSAATRSAAAEPLLHICFASVTLAFVVALHPGAADKTCAVVTIVLSSNVAADHVQSDGYP